MLFKAFAEGVSRGERLVVVIGVDPSSSSIIRGSLFLYLRPKPKRNNKLSTNLIRCFAGKKKPEEKSAPAFRAKNARAPRAISFSFTTTRDAVARVQSEIPKMILSNDQKHTFTTFSARAFVRKEETTTEGEEEEITAFFHARAAFLPFLYSCCNELLLELSRKRDFSSGSFCCFATVSGLCNSSAFSSAFVPFAPNPIFSFHQNNNERIYYYITTSQRRERKREKERERERRETLKNRFSVASSRKNQFNKTKKRSRD